MAEFPDIPEEIIKAKDKTSLAAFMELNYNTHPDKRKSFANMLKDCRGTVLRQRRFFAKKQEGEERIGKYNAVMSEKAEEALKKNPANYYLLENDTSKWPWDYSKVKWVEQGVGWGSCYIHLIQQDRKIAVDRETAAMFFQK